MKSINRLSATLIAVFFLSCFFSLGAAAAEEATLPVATTETITLAEGQTLWATFMAQKLPRKDWPNYWKEASQLSGIPHTDAAWRKLPIGSTVTAPRDPRAILADKQLNTSIAAAIAHDALERRAELAKAEAAFNDRVKGILIAISVIVVFIAGIAGMVSYILTREKKRLRDNEAIASQKSEVAPAQTSKQADGDASPSCCTPSTKKLSTDGPDTDMSAPHHWHST